MIGVDARQRRRDRPAIRWLGAHRCRQSRESAFTARAPACGTRRFDDCRRPALYLPSEVPTLASRTYPPARLAMMTIESRVSSTTMREPIRGNRLSTLTKPPTGK